ncbi:MAG: D-alanyl-D-alanine carboxypeptidase family protein, partial [Methyloligellaceae bacterium]
RRSLAARLMSFAAAWLMAVAALSAAASGPVQAAPRYAAMVVDGHTGKILYSRNGDRLRFPASLTKIMTLYLLFDYMEAGKLHTGSLLTVTPNAAKQQPSILGLKAGQKIRVSDAIRALVTKSANDVAVTIAENIGGTEKNFAKLMTAKARKIGMRRTSFKNASGLPDKGQVTTARDMITLANRLMFDHPEKYAYFKQKYFKYKGRKYRNHNRLLFDYKGTDGIKTGYTRASGFNLLANVHRGNKHLIAVVFGGKTSNSRNAAMRAILNKSLPRATARLPRKHRPATKKPVQLASSLKFPENASAIAVQSAHKTPPLPIRKTAPETVASLPAQTQKN